MLKRKLGKEESSDDDSSSLAFENHLKESIKRLKIDSVQEEELEKNGIVKSENGKYYKLKRSSECITYSNSIDRCLKQSKVSSSINNDNFQQSPEICETSCKSINELLKELHFLRIERRSKNLNSQIT